MTRMIEISPGERENETAEEKSSASHKKKKEREIAWHH
jgi:hypothetical protein